MFSTSLKPRMRIAWILLVYSVTWSCFTVTGSCSAISSASSLSPWDVMNLGQEAWSSYKLIGVLWRCFQSVLTFSFFLLMFLSSWISSLRVLYLTKIMKSHSHYTFLPPSKLLWLFIWTQLIISMLCIFHVLLKPKLSLAHFTCLWLSSLFILSYMPLLSFSQHV